MGEQLSTAVAAEVRRLLDERGWSGRELARRTGIPQPSIAKKLAGTHSFDLDDVDAICQALEIVPGELVSWAQDHDC